MTEAHWAYNTEMNDLLLTALISALHKAFERETALIYLERHGREELIEHVDLTRTIGWFTAMYPIYLENQAALGKTITHVKETLRKIPNRGVNFGIGRYLKHNEHLKQLNPEIVFNYLGQFDGSLTSTEDEHRLLTHSDEYIGLGTHGANHYPYLLDISGMVIEQKLNLQINYIDQIFTEEQMEKFKDALYSTLRDIIEHCVNQTQQIKTASDFGIEDEIDEDEFDLLTQLYES